MAGGSSQAIFRGVKDQWQTFGCGWSYDQQGHLADVPGDITKVWIVCIAPTDLIPCRVRQDMSSACVRAPPPLIHQYKKSIVPNPAWWEAWINKNLLLALAVLSFLYVLTDAIKESPTESDLLYFYWQGLSNTEW